MYTFLSCPLYSTCITFHLLILNLFLIVWSIFRVLLTKCDFYNTKLYSKIWLVWGIFMFIVSFWHTFQVRFHHVRVHVVPAIMWQGCEGVTITAIRYGGILATVQLAGMCEVVISRLMIVVGWSLWKVLCIVPCLSNVSRLWYFGS
jgi:hypothetical protein